MNDDFDNNESNESDNETKQFHEFGLDDRILKVSI